MFKLIVKKEKDAKQKGITLIALIVTIIVLIILVGITIATLTGEDGIINNANNAKEETEIANEKEIVDRATINAMGNNKRGNIVKDELQNELDRITKVGDTEVEDNGEEFEVVFVNTNRYYTVDKDGDIIEEGKIVIDKSPGDITKDESGNDIEEGQPYEIWCIEDLVAFSNMVNGNGKILENGKVTEVNNSNKFVAGTTVELKRNLNFESKYSYTNSERTDFGDINGNENDGNSLINEMTTGTGFKPIGVDLKFTGTFNGNGYEVQQIYINQTTNSVGLFGSINNGIIQSLGISGNIICNDTAGGIAGSSENSTLIQDCYNKANITSNKNSGGIIGVLYNGETTIINCYNDLQSAIKGNNAGGIVGWSRTAGGSPYIYNCFNLGNINGTGCTGGIIGYVYDYAECINVYTTGDITGNTVGGIVGSALWNNTSQNKFENCYFLKSDTVQKSAGSKITVNASMLDNLTDTTINELNSCISNNGSLTYEWKKWTLGSDGYPVFV